MSTSSRFTPETDEEAREGLAAALAEAVRYLKDHPREEDDERAEAA